MAFHRQAFAIVLLAHAASAFANSCVTVALDVRTADVVAIAHYSGDRTFAVESILRTVSGDRPSKLVGREHWRSFPCAPPEPEAGRSYVVALYANGALGYRDAAEASYERALVGRLHAVSARSILGALRSYSDGDWTRDRVHDWLLSGVIEPRRKDSFTEELLDAAKTFLNHIAISEACNRELVASMRTEKLPAAVRAIARRVPAVDTEELFVRERGPAMSEEDALEEWDEILWTIADALGPLEKELRALPWCDHAKAGW